MTNEIKTFLRCNSFCWSTNKANKMKGIASNFYTTHDDVGPTLTVRFATNANYKRYNGLQILVSRSHAIFIDLMKPNNTTEWSCAALCTIT